MASYKGKTLVLTGASQGIGKALALAVSPEGPSLVLAAREEVALRQVAEECRARGAKAVVQVTDVTRQGDCVRLVERAVEGFGGIDVLVNNAGASMWARFEEVRDLKVYEDLLRVNYLSAVYLSHASLPHLRRSKGQIVAVASLAGLTGVPTRSGYAASKHAMIGFFDSLRIELEGSGVSVTVVAPDFVASEIHRRSVGGDGKPLGGSPMQESRIMTADRCSAMILGAMRRRRRLAILSWRGRIGRIIRIFAPSLIDRVAERAVRRGR